MNTVYVIGAGCTRNYETSNEFGLKSPVDSDFFEICNKILLARKDIAKAFLHLTEHLKLIFGLNLGKGERFQGLSLETVTTILDLESREKDRQYIDSLINLICIVFDIVLRGPTSPIHNELTKRIEPNDVVISYNYDLVMDNSLMESLNLEQTIYGLNFDRKFDVDWKPCENEHSNIHLLKLHGSMNWLKCSRCGALLFYGGRKVVAELSYQLMGINKSSSDLSCPICQAKELGILLIPPLLGKELAGEEFRYPWYLAERALVSADRIVVIGYSLPPTDFYSEYLIRKAVSRRFRSKPTLHIVNKDTKMTPKRFEAVFGVKTSEKYGDLREYLNKTIE